MNNLNNNQYYHRYIFKLFPTKEQEIYMDQCIEINNFIYNWGLELEDQQLVKYKLGISQYSYLSEYDLQKLLVQYRQNNNYIASFPIEIERGALRRLDHAYKVYMDHSLPNNHPRYKEGYKASRSFSLRSDRFYIDHNGCRLDGLPRFQLINLNFDTGLTREFKYWYPVISKNYICQYWIGFSIIEFKPKINIPIGFPIAIDINARENARLVLSNGIRYSGPNNFYNAIRNINNSQKALTLYRERMKEWNKLNDEPYIKSNNELKKEEIFHKRYAKLTNITQNFYYTATKEILINYHPAAIIIEDLDVQAMLKKPYIADDVHHACFGYFKQIMEYECNKYNIPLLKVPASFNSSKICSYCGYHMSDFKDQLSFNCPICGASIDRDYNAALNLLHYYFQDERLS